MEVEVRTVGDDGGGAPLEQGDPPGGRERYGEMRGGGGGALEGGGGAPHLCDRAVEGGRRLLDEDVALREAEQPRAPAKPVPHAGGRDEAALRLA